MSTIINRLTKKVAGGRLYVSLRGDGTTASSSNSSSSSSSSSSSMSSPCTGRGSCGDGGGNKKGGGREGSLNDNSLSVATTRRSGLSVADTTGSCATPSPISSNHRQRIDKDAQSPPTSPHPPSPTRPPAPTASAAAARRSAKTCAKRLIRNGEYQRLVEWLDTAEGRRQVFRRATTREEDKELDDYCCRRERDRDDDRYDDHDDHDDDDDHDQDTVLHVAVRECAPAHVLDLLLDMDPTLAYARGRRGRTALHVAAASAVVATSGAHNPDSSSAPSSSSLSSSSSVEASSLVRSVRQILDRCIDEDEADRVARVVDDDGWTALHLACLDPSEFSDEDDDENVSNAGGCVVRPNYGGGGGVFSRRLAAEAAVACVGRCGKRGGGRNDDDCDGESASDVPKRPPHRKLVELVYVLCRASPSSVNVEDLYERTPIECAIENELGFDVVRLLRKASEAAWKGRSRENTNAALRNIVLRGKGRRSNKMAQAA